MTAAIGGPNGASHLVITPLAPSPHSGIVDRVSTPTPPPPDTEDLRGLARSLRLLLEIGVRTLSEDAGPSELALRVTGHLGCELSSVVSVAERFPKWEHVNIQRGIDAFLAAQHNDAEWFSAPGAGQRPHENMLSLISTPEHLGGVRVMGMGRRRIGVTGVVGGSGEAGIAAASYGTVAIGPEENTEVVTFGLVTATAPDGVSGRDRGPGREPVRAALVQP